jgi:nucleoside-diphosphate-sugar epimerase
MNSSQENVLVTGSSGFIGRRVIERLVKNFTVIGLDRPGAPHPPPEAACVDVDLRSTQSVQAGLQQVRQKHGERLASVIHLAAYYDFSGEPSDLYDEITIQGTERLIQTLKLDFRVEQFAFSSTMLVHEPCEPGQLIDEDSPISATWDYPESKIKTERLLRSKHSDIPLVLLRISGVYDDACHSIPLAHQIQRIYERRFTSGVYPGDTSRGQAFLHLDDLVDAIELLVARRAQLPHELTLLLGEPETMSYDELQRTIGQLIHVEEWNTRQIPKVVAKTGAWLQDHLPGVDEPFIKLWMIDRADDHYALDISSARQLLNWEPKHSLRTTLPKKIAALLADPQEWYRENNLQAPSDWEEVSAQPAGKGHDGS